jgi:hypothetical protein
MDKPRKPPAETDRELQLKRELDAKYCDPKIIDPNSLVDLGEDTRSWFSKITRQLNCENYELTADKFNSNKIKKETLGQWLEDVVDLLERSESVIMHMLGIVDKS